MRTSAHPPRRANALSHFALVLACSAALVSCKDKKGYKGKTKSAALQWIDSPVKGAKEDNFIKIPSLGVAFEIPETRYVFKNCFEQSHSAEQPTGWIPLIRCMSSSGGGGGEDSGDSWEEGADDSSYTEEIALTFYIAPKDRPIDERSVAYFRNTYQGEGIEVRELSFNDDYHDKRGIYSELVVPSGDDETPATEIIQFLFPMGDVIFVARMEYPFGDTRAVTADWKAMMWYFKVEGLEKKG